jgi:hypothetical protein
MKKIFLKISFIAMLLFTCIYPAKVGPVRPFGLGNLGDSCWLAGGTQTFLAACYNDPTIRELIRKQARNIKNPDSMTLAFRNMVENPREQETRAFIQEMWCHEKARSAGAWGGEPSWLLHEIRDILWHKFFILVPSVFEWKYANDFLRERRKLFAITFSSHRHRGAFVRYGKQWFLCNDARITALSYDTNYIVFRDKSKEEFRRFLIVKDPEFGDIQYDFDHYYFMYGCGNAYAVNDICPECHKPYGPPPQENRVPNEYVIERLSCGHFRHVKSDFYLGQEGPEYCSREFADKQDPERCPLCPKAGEERKQMEPAAPTSAVPAYSLKNFAQEIRAFQQQVVRQVGLKELPPKKIQEIIAAQGETFRTAVQAHMFQDMRATQEPLGPALPSVSPTFPPRPPSAQTWWPCPTCTFLNNPARTVCEMCGALRK